MNGVGVVLLFCVPVAYVSLDNLEVLPSMRRLRVLCAGVWHNVVLALVALCVMAATPWLVLPFYNWGSGVQIQAVQQVIDIVNNIKNNTYSNLLGPIVVYIVSLNNCNFIFTNNFPLPIKQFVYIGELKIKFVKSKYIKFKHHPLPHSLRYLKSHFFCSRLLGCSFLLSRRCLLGMGFRF